MQESPKTFYHVSDLIPSVIAELSGEKQAKPEKGFLRYGLASLDRFTGGLHGKDLVVITGCTDYLRCAFCGKIVRNLAMMRKVPVLVLPFAVSPDEFVKILVCQMADIDSALLSPAKISSLDLGHEILSTLNKIKASNIYLTAGSANNPQTACEEIMSFSNLHSPFVIACLGLQMSKMSEEQPDWRYAFENLKTRISKDYAILVCIEEERAANIVQASNVIFRLVDEKAGSSKKSLELKIQRNTHGPLGSARFMFNLVSGGVEEYGSYDKERLREDSCRDKTGTGERKDEVR